MLDSTRLTERDGDPMCRSCYSKVRLLLVFIRNIVNTLSPSL